MIRKAFTMTLRPGSHAEYTKRHNPIWPELEAILSDHGVRSYSIFLDQQTGRLFAYAEIEDETRWDAISRTEVCGRWWRSMRELMDVNADDSPATLPLREVFHLG